MQSRGKMGSDCHRGSRSPNNGLICLLVYVTLYSKLGFEKHSATKLMLANKDSSSTHVEVYTQLTAR